MALDVWVPGDIERIITALTVAGADKDAAYHAALRDVALALGLGPVAQMCHRNTQEDARLTKGEHDEGPRYNHGEFAPAV